MYSIVNITHFLCFFAFVSIILLLCLSADVLLRYLNLSPGPWATPPSTPPVALTSQKLHASEIKAAPTESYPQTDQVRIFFYIFSVLVDVLFLKKTIKVLNLCNCTLVEWFGNATQNIGFGVKEAGVDPDQTWLIIAIRSSQNRLKTQGNSADEPRLWWENLSSWQLLFLLSTNMSSMQEQHKEKPLLTEKRETKLSIESLPQVK